MQRNIVLTVPSLDEMEHIEALLWRILWKPLGFPCGIREAFKLEGKEVVLITKRNNVIMGAIIANQTSEYGYEIRHLAVDQPYQKMGAGKKMVMGLEQILIKEEIKTIQTISRNTSRDFFEAVGYKKVEDYPDHPDFKRHGISFVLMRKLLPRMRP